MRLRGCVNNKIMIRNKVIIVKDYVIQASLQFIVFKYVQEQWTRSSLINDPFLKNCRT